jgi:gliding motility-associated-like protein
MMIDSITIINCNTLTVASDTTICSGERVTLSAMGIPSGGTYLWTPGNSTDSFVTVSPTVGTVYIVTYTPVIGSPITNNIHVSISPPASLVILPSDTIVLQENSLQLTSYFNGYPVSNITGYSWNPPAGLSCINCSNPILSTAYLTDSFNVYTLNIMYNNGCIVTAEDTVNMELLQMLAIPTAFTPNGDGKNDNYLILAKGVVDFKLCIYNRWGEEVFVSSDINIGWDGNYKDKLQPEEDYQFFFTICYLNGKSESHSGTLTLIR